ncbi:MAG: hypothetical protein COZ68_02880 [Deltaproteobacteria bacterium CG_4_8_14_3_um_filter_43_13]|nr:MAG: hypothetical protein AUK23_00215 [Deltaproteobacteria bacterium CG2_30_43_15]PIU84524.1 MAG: hypothetical protein COS67_12790 [Deltaproteobacteria bacterium CG06_land_8_20_14_3_00_44_19]PIX25868.1 MAG: hypothetical protein COZ68_02880 [Deltaproteobacteria bacterium CG_4_8_14_3_um_filter_43_13]
MPVSTLNKTIALFLVGILGVAWVVILAWKPLAAFIAAYPELSSPAGSVALGSLSLALAAFVGSIIEGLTDVTVRRLVQAAARRERWARFLGQSRVHASSKYWENEFQQLATKQHLFESALERDFTSRAHVANGIFHAHASNHHIEWVISHYSTYYLVSCYLFVLGLFGLLVPQLIVFLPEPRLIWTLGVLVALLVSAYALFALAVDRYLYSFQALFRFAAFWLSETRVAGYLSNSERTSHGT